MFSSVFTCLFVSLLAGLLKTTRPIITIWWKGGTWAKEKKRLDFVSNRDLG